LGEEAGLGARMIMRTNAQKEKGVASTPRSALCIFFFLFFFLFVRFLLFVVCLFVVGLLDCWFVCCLFMLLHLRKRNLIAVECQSSASFSFQEIDEMI
jgi:hypothetical protein